MNTPPSDADSEILKVLQSQSRSIRNLRIMNTISCGILIVILFLPRLALKISEYSDALLDSLNPYVASILTILFVLTVTILVAAYIVSSVAPSRSDISRPEENY